MALWRKTKRMPPFAKIDVGIDKCFTIKEKGNIIEAFMRWQDSTNGLVLFHIGNMSIKKLIMHDDDPRTWYAINIVKVNSNDLEVKKQEKRFGRTLTGLAIFLESSAFAFVVADRLKTNEKFIGLVMHEVGHLLGLRHDSKDTIMYKYSGTANVTGSDLNQLIGVWRRCFGLAVHEHKYASETS